MTKVEFDTVRCCVIGLGCERGTSVSELHELALTALAMARIDPRQLAGLASINARNSEPAICAVAAYFGVPSIFFDAQTLERETPRIKTPSKIVFARIGCHGVAESAALAASGPAAELILPKIKSAHATAAIARILLQKQ
ncbi:cobalamin biosynthesis protein [Rhizobium sp. Root1220]|uniref:cobalamin biosynthesis protein n=1 Tax=Rhizobium sp. Root1220 TaxID=1736432 RepID=UPI0006FDBFB2|nr:cobalamin biosynthesis protein [Rhizobium sp. Root1220]KQV81783.1 precorrin methylase [Rhizobium sp. Root1220]